MPHKKTKSSYLLDHNVFAKRLRKTITIKYQICDLYQVKPKHIKSKFDQTFSLIKEITILSFLFSLLFFVFSINFILILSITIILLPNQPFWIFSYLHWRFWSNWSFWCLKRPIHSWRWRRGCQLMFSIFRSFRRY